MSPLDNTIAVLELAQICRVVPDIHAAVGFLESALGITGFPEPERMRAEEPGMTYIMVRPWPGEWLITQTCNGAAVAVTQWATGP